MFDNYEMTLVRVEGLGDVSNCICNLLVNNEPFESVSLHSLETTPHLSSLPSKANLKIRIESTHLLASLQFSLQIIKCQGYHWMPLFKEKNDSIYEVPEEVGLPRILLIFQSQKFLSPVIEITETSEISENIEFAEFTEDNSKNIELRMKIIELEQTLQFERVNQVQNLEKMTKDYKSMLDKSNFEMEKFKVWSGKYKEKCLQLTQELEDKEKAVKNLYAEKEILAAELTLYKEKYAELVRVQGLVYSMLETKEQEIETIKNQPKNPIFFEKCEEIHIFPQKPEKKCKLLKYQSDSLDSEPQSDETLLDFYLQDSLSQLKLEGFFQKTTEKFYRVGCKKVGVILKNKNIYCKFGENLKTLESYIYSHCSAELESFIKKRANSKPSHRRFKTFSGSFEQNLVLEQKSFNAEKQLAATLKNKSITPNRSRGLPVKAKVL